ncbi:MAG: LacI family DNA-binding transcriptional regulator [Microbacteriaceae bacterium]
MREVAALAGVSLKTVSRVFNNDRHVTPATRHRVEMALREVNYVPNALATTFRAGRTAVIGIAVPDIVDPFFAAVSRSVENFAVAHGMSTLITSLGDDPSRERPTLESMLSRQLSGIIVAPVAPDHAWLQTWAVHTPLVFVDRPPVGLTADSFREDDHLGALLATEHLIEHGHRRIAFIGDTRYLPTTNNRLRGYKDALRKGHIDFDPMLVTLEAADRDGARTALDEFWRLPDPPTAVFSSNARSSMAMIPALQEHPAAAISFGDFPMADLLTPSLTVVAQDPERLGSLAAARAVDRLRAPDATYESTTYLPVRLVERESCRVGDETYRRRKRA